MKPSDTDSDFKKQGPRAPCLESVRRPIHAAEKSDKVSEEGIGSCAQKHMFVFISKRKRKTHAHLFGQKKNRITETINLAFVFRKL